jgi:hypothetical protein
MKIIDEYFAHVRHLIESIDEAHPERHEEEVLSPNRGNLRIRLRYRDNALLEISEAVVIVHDKLECLSYRYHYQDAAADLILRYDNAPHRPETVTHPDHKHIAAQVVASSRPSIQQVLEEVQMLRSGSESGS